MRLFKKIDDCLDRAQIKTIDSFFDASMKFYLAYGLPSFDPYKEFSGRADLSMYHALHTPLTAPMAAAAFTLKLLIETMEGLIRLPYDYLMKKSGSNKAKQEFETDKHYALFGVVMILISTLVTALSPLIMLISLAARSAASLKVLVCSRGGDRESNELKITV